MLDRGWVQLVGEHQVNVVGALWDDDSHQAV